MLKSEGRGTEIRKKTEDRNPGLASVAIFRSSDFDLLSALENSAFGPRHENSRLNELQLKAAWREEVTLRPRVVLPAGLGAFSEDGRTKPNR